MKRITFNLALTIPDDGVTAGDIINFFNLPPKGGRVYVNYHIDKTHERVLKHGDLLSYAAEIPS